LKTLGVLGPRGTHSEEAAIYLNKLLGGKFQLKICAEIFEVLHKVEIGELDSGFVPVENSLEGSINITLDTLARSKTLIINPISQCRRYLRKNFPNAEIITTLSTARAAEIVASSEEKFAAICSERAGKLNNLNILAEEIQDNPFNSTRFFEIGRCEKIFDEKNITGDKISLVCMFDGSQAGSLYSVLEEFAKRKINMTHIESRPARLELGEYIFFFDLEVGADKKILQDAINAVREKTIWLKHLGNFPVINILEKV